MKANMGTLDKSVRVLIALIVIALYFTGVIGGTLAIVLLVVSGIFILTSLVSFCPLYLPLGINTRGKTNE